MRSRRVLAGWVLVAMFSLGLCSVTVVLFATDGWREDWWLVCLPVGALVATLAALRRVAISREP